MRSRSRRLFVILFHLIVFHIPQNNHLSHYAGMIIGVHPSPISLESIQLDEGLVGFMDTIVNAQDYLQEPFWIQDSVDGKCLGPSGGFSDCGDATLWFIRAKRDVEGGSNVITKGLQKVFRFFSDNPSTNTINPTNQNWKFALQLSNHDMSQQNNNNNHTDEKGDCLVLLKNRKDPSKYSFRLRSCDKESAWNWNVNGNGYLMSLGGKKEKQQSSVCIWRDWGGSIMGKSGSTLVAPCVDGRDLSYRLVSFSLVRLQQAGSSTPIPTEPKYVETTPAPKLIKKVDESTIEAKLARKVVSEPTESKIPHTMTASESHAHSSLHHLELLPMNSLRIPPDTATTIIKGSNPLLFHPKEPNFNINTIKPTEIGTTPRLSLKKGISTHHHQIKMPTHPYITESKGGLWTDTSTDLQYPTDLVSFLGHDRNTHGRHTLMGVGQYTRTVFKVKIYGVALYVSKRDVLADPNFSKYAMESKEELQGNDDFYKYLYATPSEGNAEFDRTLMIKLNMQLGVETIRTCLQSEWKYLTDEHKDSLIGSSLKKRDADEEMLNIIKDPENTSHCSCSQIAPEEYEADSTCCARGTEMVFTWKKDGTLELRMNRRFIDSFPAEIAQGIFYEYLRIDDPMSDEARLNFATGFPFLLAPLAQVKGVVVGKSAHTFIDDSRFRNNNNHEEEEEPDSKKGKKTNPFLIDIGHTIIKQSKNVLMGSVNSVCAVAQTGLGAAQEAGNELHLQVSKLLRRHNKNQLTIFTPTAVKEEAVTTESIHTFSSFDAPYIDEIAVNMPPTNSFTHQLFSLVVHLYLLLLLVISIPEYNIKTIRMVTPPKQKTKPKNEINNTNNNSLHKVRTSIHRNSSSFRDSFSIMPIIEEVHEEEEEEKVDGLFYDDDIPKEHNIKKSLSYFL